jgi:hypothetical protein
MSFDNLPGNIHPEPETADSGICSIGAVESVEYALQLLRSHTNPLVGNRNPDTFAGSRDSRRNRAVRG